MSHPLENDDDYCAPIMQCGPFTIVSVQNTTDKNRTEGRAQMSFLEVNELSESGNGEIFQHSVYEGKRADKEIKGVKTRGGG